MLDEFKLTPKQRIFCDEYLISFNARDAAVKAGYSLKSAYVIGCDNLAKVNIKNYIDDRLKKIQCAKVATAQEVMEFLTKIMNDEITEESISVINTGGGFSDVKITDKKISAKDRLAAANLIGKRYTLFTDKVDVTGEVVLFTGESELKD